MTRHRLINWLMAIAIALTMSGAWLLDSPDDIATAQAIADDLASLQTEQVQR